jgi:uncharacterized repeat protein (TIGR01451 family)
MRNVAGSWLRVTVLGALLLLGLGVAQPGYTQTPVFINEIHYDNAGTDSGEAIEVAGPAGTNLTGWTIVLYNGNGGAAYDTKTLSGAIPDLCSGYGVMVQTTAGLQNGAPDGVALVNNLGAVIQFLSYEGTFTAVGGAANGMLSVDIGVSEAGTEPVGQSLRLSGTGLFYENFTWNSPATASFGACNTGQTFGGALPNLSINDVSQSEGNSGTTTFTFTVSLSTPATVAVSFNYGTADGTATIANNDYAAATGSGSIAIGGSSTTVSVTVNGDTTEEPNETFFVNLSSVTGANATDAQGQGTIQNDDIVPHLSITDVTATEGNSGTTTFAFQVSITSGSATFDIATADGTATTADNDYVANSAPTQTVTAGTPYVFSVTVNGDTTVESDETFHVNITNVSAGVTVDDAQGLGTIQNDDTPTLSINDVTVTEGNSGTVTASFTVSLSAPANPGGVSFDIATADGTATTAGNDYVAHSIVGQTIAASGSSFTFDVTVNGDTTFENTETFAVNVTNVTGATLGDGSGQGTITNDDTAPNIVINEILADPAGGLSGDANGDGYRDTGSAEDEFVELVNASGADLEISGWTLSDGFGVRHTFPAGTIVTNNCGIVVFGGGTPTGAFGGSVVQTASTGTLGLNNSGDTVTLRNGPAGAPTVVTYTYGSEGGNDQSLTRSPDITGPTPLVRHTTATGSGGARFSPGKLLTGWPFSGCTITAMVAEIFDIQGAGTASPHAGYYVTTSDNVVTAVASDGFFIQTPDARADADDDTSNGIMVYTSSTPTVAVGDVVNVTGEVKEYFGFTEITFPTVTSGTGPLAMPAAIEFDESVPDHDPGALPAPACAIEYECWEGMRVNVATGTAVGPTQWFSTDPTAEFFAVAGTSPRPFREVGAKYPGLGGTIPVWDGNPEVFEVDPDRLGATTDPDIVRVGSTFSASGVLAYSYEGWVLWATAFTSTDPTFDEIRPVREPSPLEFTVGSYNLLNLNSTTGDYAQRCVKHSMYIRDVLHAPDVLGVAEVENLVTLQGLATQLNSDDPSLGYVAWLQMPDQSGIDVGFLVRNTVTDVSIQQLGKAETFVYNSTTYTTHDRPPLLLTGHYVANGAASRFAVMVNHTRSFIDIETDGFVRAKRIRQSQSIAQMVQTFQTTPANSTTPLILVGDYNAFQFTDGYVDVIGQISGTAVAADNQTFEPNITTPTLTNQVLTVPAAKMYSYTFEGTAQVIDHALTTQVANPWINGLEFGRANADAPGIGYDQPGTPLRSSDHDGLVVYVATDANDNGVPDDLDQVDLAITKTDSPDPVLAGASLTYTLAVANNGTAPAFNVTVTDTLPAGVTYGTASGTGWTCNQAAGVVTCTRPALAVGAAPDITITVTVPVVGGTLSNTATVSCPLADPVSANNSSAITTTVTAVTDLGLTMAANPGTAGPGEPFVHSAVVTNHGPSPATGVVLTVTVPAGTAVGTITPGACSLGGSTVTCTVGALASGATFNASITLSAAASGSYTSQGTVTGTELDLDASDNTASATTVIGRVLVAPSPVVMRVPLFSTGQTTLTITNDSPLAIGYQIYERDKQAAWPRPAFAGPSWQVPESATTDRDGRAAPEHTLPSIPVKPLAPSAILNFDTGMSWPWGIGLDTDASSVWIGDEDNVNYRFLLDGTPTTDTIDTTSWCPLPNWGADMAYDPATKKLWQVLVGLDNCIYEMDPATKTSTGQKICPAFGTSERGLAYDPVTETFFAGSWTDGRIKRFDRTGTILENITTGLPVSGLAYNPATGHLFALLNTSSTADLVVLDVENAYAVVDAYRLTGMASYEEAGLELACDGSLYAVNQTTTEVLVVPSGEIGGCFTDVPWLDETPKSGSIAADSSALVQLDFNTDTPRRGLHQAELFIGGLDPFAPRTVPVTYTIAFLDVPETHWADPQIHGLAGVGVAYGFPGGFYEPESFITRSQMAAFLIRATHGPDFKPPQAIGIFNDVTPDHWSADYIEQLYVDGITTGCVPGVPNNMWFCPEENVTRAQMAVFLVRAVHGQGFVPPPATGIFTDVGLDHWAVAHIEQLYADGITTGCVPGTPGNMQFCPESFVTRAEMAVFLVRAFDIPYLH